MRAPVKMFTDDIDNLEQINMFPGMLASQLYML